MVFSRKILLLPGSSSSAGAFLNMPTGAAPLIGAAKATYHDGGRLAWLFEAIDPPTPSGEWFCPGGTADGADESIAVVEAALEVGEFVGLVGFDDGAALASLVAARAALGDGRTTSLQFAVLCSALTPTPTLTLTLTLTRTRNRNRSRTRHRHRNRNGSRARARSCAAPRCPSRISRCCTGCATPAPRPAYPRLGLGLGLGFGLGFGFGFGSGFGFGLGFG